MHRPHPLTVALALVTGGVSLVLATGAGGASIEPPSTPPATSEDADLSHAATLRRIERDLVRSETLLDDAHDTRRRANATLAEIDELLSDADRVIADVERLLERLRRARER